MKDVTSDENTPYHHEEFNIHLKSIFIIEEVKDDENSGYNSILLGLIRNN